jgi:cytochrome c peroxidase
MKKYMIIMATVAVLLLLHASFKGTEPATKAELGKLLFSDPILSRDKTISCASCHLPAYAFADTAATSKGVGGARGVRNTPSAMNVKLQRTFFWDGRAKTLEEQALKPIENPVEMDLPVEQAVLRLQAHPTYAAYFKKIFNAEPSRENLAEAIAAFERTLETSDSPFDEWKFYDRPEVVSEAVKRGFDVFNGKGKCILCHFGADFTANEFRNIGLFDGKKLNDSGRMVITGNPDDLGRFKTGSLRNVAITAPYMHNGMFNTLKEVIDFYNDPAKVVPGGINRDSLLRKPLELTTAEKNDLEAFLIALTDKQFNHINRLPRQ